MNRFKVVVCGGGIAGLEGLLRLHRILGDRADITLMTTDPVLEYRPLAVREPFEPGPAPTLPISRLVADTGVTWIPEALHWVDRHARVIHSSAGRSIEYDALLLAVGARPRPANPHMDVFTSSRGPKMIAGSCTKLTPDA